MSDNTSRRRPTQLGGRGNPGAGAPAPEAAQPHDPQAAQITTQSGSQVDLPADVAAELGRQTSPPTNVASGTASKLAGQQPSDGQPKQDAGASISIASLLAPPIHPERDLTNPGWRYPRYYYYFVRLLAFRLRVEQQTVAAELMYAGILGKRPGGVLADVDPKLLAKLLQESYKQALGPLGEQQ